MAMISDPDLAARGRSALEHHQWREAFDLLAQADARGELEAPGLTLLADAAWWTGQLPVAIDARERAYAGATRAGDLETAIAAAILLARENLLRNGHSVANGWLNRAERLLADLPENEGHGWLAATRSFYASVTGQSELALAEAERAYQIGRRLGNHDIEVFGLSEKGAALLARGELEAGLAAVDEATVAAVSGELEPIVAGGVCCTTIESCAALGDWRRAAEWTEAQDRWARREGLNGYPGMCRLFRSDVKRLRGAWLEAEAEARRASDELLGYIPAAVGQAHYQIGQIRLLRGDLAGAEEALLQGHSFGRDPEPTLSLLRLAEGNLDAASSGIRRALSEPPSSPSWSAPSDSELYRLTLLPAQVEIALAVNDLITARSAAEGLSNLAGKFATLASHASAALARGTVALAESDAATATRELRQAVRWWTELDAPYEAARARRMLAEALLADGAGDAAVVELRAALDGFEQLGALAELRRTSDALAGIPGATASAAGQPMRLTRAFMFTDIVDSTQSAERLGDEAWNRVLRWHDSAVRSLVAEYAGEDVKRTGDGFFLAFANADAAIGCAIAIQRRLAEPRAADAPAVSVRMGIHLAEATRSGLDYIGTGVNEAARIAGAAGASEILASTSTLAGTRAGFVEQDRRVIELRGISAPVEVVSIDWR
jgi:class 3 adenylate cyclase